ncbi:MULTISPECIES: hypothetical protein [Bacillus]|uniref:hypothetical protein n=1 Tax=Bacillus TaxID=1386 RepID=UPI000A768DC3|nr:MULTISPECIES: hypothetical protein [Bacillus]
MTFDELMELSEEEFINYDFKREVFDLRNLIYEKKTLLQILFYIKVIFMVPNLIVIDYL